MDKTQKYLEIKCEVCGEKYLQQERLFKKALWKYRCRKHRKTLYYCVDCGKNIWKGSKRCKTCSGKHRSTRVQNFCIDCNTPISRLSKSRCLPCHNKKQDKGKSRARTKFNTSKKWKDVRTKAFERDDYTCLICNKRGVYLHGHHIKSYSNHPEHRLDVENIATLCSKCHHQLHHNKKVKNKHKHLIFE